MTQVSARATKRTFCRDPGMLHWLPGSYLALRVFPKRLEVHAANLANTRFLGSVILESIPVGDFAIFTDWTRGELCIRLQADKQLQIWQLKSIDRSGWSCQLLLKRASTPCQVTVEIGDERCPWMLLPKERLVLSWDPSKDRLFQVSRQVAVANELEPPALTQVFFGCHKAAHWPQIRERGDLREVGPLLHFAGQWARELLPPLSPLERTEACACFDRGDLESSDRDLSKNFRGVWKTHFGPCAFPRWEDEEQRGSIPLWQSEKSPLYLYLLFSEWLERRLWEETSQGLRFLPLLPSLCHAGRVLRAPSSFGTVDIYWSKKKLQRIAIYCTHSGKYPFAFPNYVQQVRAKRADRKFGVYFPLHEVSQVSLTLERGMSYELDRFNS